jgi:phage shock protein C
VSAPQPGLLNRLHRNPRRGVIFGVCAGIAEYCGFDIAVTRVVAVLLLLFAPPIMCIAYVLLGIMLPRKESPGPGEADVLDPVQRQVRASPHDMLSNTRYRFRDLDTRLARLEKYVTSNRFSLDREFRRLKE